MHKDLKDLGLLSYEEAKHKDLRDLGLLSYEEAKLYSVNWASKQAEIGLDRGPLQLSNHVRENFSELLFELKQQNSYAFVQLKEIYLSKFLHNISWDLLWFCEVRWSLSN